MTRHLPRPRENAELLTWRRPDITEIIGMSLHFFLSVMLNSFQHLTGQQERWIPKQVRNDRQSDSCFLVSPTGLTAK